MASVLLFLIFLLLALEACLSCLQLFSCLDLGRKKLQFDKIMFLYMGQIYLRILFFSLGTLIYQMFKDMSYVKHTISPPKTPLHFKNDMKTHLDSPFSSIHILQTSCLWLILHLSHAHVTQTRETRVREKFFLTKIQIQKGSKQIAISGSHQ